MNFFHGKFFILNPFHNLGLDLRMTLYKCVATDVNEGLLEVVQKAETVCKIQMRTGITPTSAVFKKGLLMSWLKYHNPTIADRAKAQEQFTLSCAGYSVAAYVLGIGDRHNDNIMVKTSGQMFHIGSKNSIEYKIVDTLLIYHN